MVKDRAESEALCCTPLGVAAFDEQQSELLASKFKALADPVRVRLVSILAALPDGEVCACDMPGMVSRKQSTVSHHLKILAEAGIITREQRGKWAWFRLRDGALDDLRDLLPLGH